MDFVWLINWYIDDNLMIHKGLVIGPERPLTTRPRYRFKPKK